jgi:hypothetical protein
MIDMKSKSTFNQTVMRFLPCVWGLSDNMGIVGSGVFIVDDLGIDQGKNDGSTMMSILGVMVM